MKKFVTLSLLALLTINNGISVFAAEKITVDRNKIKVIANEKQINTDNFLYNGTTYVPLRAVSENLNADVEYNSKTNTAKINSYSQINSYDKEKFLTSYEIFMLLGYSKKMSGIFLSETDSSISISDYSKQLNDAKQIQTLCLALRNDIYNLGHTYSYDVADDLVNESNYCVQFAQLIYNLQLTSDIEEKTKIYSELSNIISKAIAIESTIYDKMDNVYTNYILYDYLQ